MKSNPSVRISSKLEILISPSVCIIEHFTKVPYFFQVGSGRWEYSQKTF